MATEPDVMTIAELLAKHGIELASTEPGRHYTTCPRCSRNRSKAHQGTKVLGVTIEDDGSVHWGCNHCTWTGPEKGSGQRQELQNYAYRDTDGVPRFRKVRNLPGRSPRFWLEQPDGRGGWKRGTKGVDTKILYRVDEVTKAINQGHCIAVAEGEKDVDNLWRIGIAATCNAHGASEPGKQPKWTKAHGEQLRDADVVVFNDNDAAGYAHADATCKLSLGIAKRVRRLDLAPHWMDMPTGADISDWLARGRTREELVALIAQAPDYAAPEPEPNQEPKPTDFDAEIERIAKLSVVEYEQQRKQAAQRLDVRASILDKLVQAERLRLNPDADDGKQGHAISFSEPEPWPEPMDGAALLNGIASAIRSHVVMSDHCRDTTTLWTLHAYLIDRFLVSPRLGVRSPIKQCGKTTLFDVLARLTPRSLSTQNVSPAVIFRVVEAHGPTLYIDEGDTFLKTGERADEMRGILNGNRKGSTVLRTVGDDHEPRAFSTYCACAIALIGELPDTIHDRSVIVDLKRRLRSERITPFRPDRADHLDVLARKAARWAKDHADSIAERDPEMPPGIINREADNWRPLLAIAHEAGGEWPERIRAAVLAAHDAAAAEQGSWIELLLGDVRNTFAQLGGAPVTELFATSADLEIPSKALVETLIAIEGRPWGEMGKSRKPMTQNRLARMLSPLKIFPGKVGPEDARLQGYKLGQFKDAFERLLAPEGASQPDIRTKAHEIRTSDDFKVDSPDDGCPVAKCEKPNNDGLLSRCPVAKRGTGEKTQMRTNGGTDTSFTPHRIRELSRWCLDRAEAQRQAKGGEFDQSVIERDLRAALWQEAADAGEVERAFEAVMRIMFDA